MIKGTIIVAKDICKGCELCIASCPVHCIGLSDQLNIKGYHFAQLIADTCTGCVNCAVVFPDSAITVYRMAKPAKKVAA